MYVLWLTSLTFIEWLSILLSLINKEICFLHIFVKHPSAGPSGGISVKGHSVVPFFSFIFWPCGVFIAAHGFSLVAAGEHYSSLQRVGFSGWCAWAPECVGSVVTARGLNGPMACGILVLQPGIESSVLEEGRFLTTGPPEKSLNWIPSWGRYWGQGRGEPLSQKAPFSWFSSFVPTASWTWWMAELSLPFGMLLSVSPGSIALAPSAAPL